jgi:HlyD family secretion protein
MSMSSSSSAVAEPAAPGLLGGASDPARRQARERQRARGRNLRQALLILALGAAAVGTVLALRPVPVPADVAQVRRAPLQVAIEETGRTRVKDRYLVSAPLTGRVSRSRFTPGDLVSEGDTLAEISPALSPLLDRRTRAETEARLGAALSAQGQSRAQVARARTAREQAERDAARARELAGSGSLPRQALEEAEFALRLRGDELSSAEFAVKVASEEVRLARAALERASAEGGADGHLDVLAPASGRVLAVQQQSAGVVQAGAPLLEVGDPTQLEGVVDLLTTDAVRVRPGTQAEIIGWGGERRLPARVTEIEPSAFTRPSALGVDEQRVNVILTLDEPREQWAALGDGYHIEARIILWSSPEVLQVPLGAAFRRGGSWATYVVDGGRARLRSVEVGHRGETGIEIVSGLQPGETVIVHPGDRVQDGVRVELAPSGG